MKIIKTHKSFGGNVTFYSHFSQCTQTTMNFSTFIPSQSVERCIVWLSGLTCNEENFISKSGVQKFLSDTHTMVICPDTSPRGLDLPNEHKNYDFGSGAGFYLNALTEGYSGHYRMFDYVAEELYELIGSHFLSATGKISIMGHSMGGHGALVIGLTFPDKYTAISAFSPIVNPINCNWGKKAFTGYLGKQNEKIWCQYDACELIKAGKKHHNTILIDQGTVDPFLEKELLTQNFIDSCNQNHQPLQVQFRNNYDHSYYFISTFIESHITFHLSNL